MSEPAPAALRVPAPLRWLLVAPLLLWVVVRLAGLERGWLLVQLMSFTPFAAVASLLVLVIILLTRDRWPIVLALLACLGLGAATLPRAFGIQSKVDGPMLTVMSVNLRLGQADAATIVDLVRTHHVDVLAVQEFSIDGDAALEQGGLLTMLPHAERDPVVGSPGSAVYSRQPISDSGYVTNGGGFRQAYATVYLPGADPVRIESVHPVPPVDTAGTRDWTTDLAAEPPAAQVPLQILAGDFNSTLDHANLRRLIATGYHDAASAVGEGLTPTWPYYGPRSTVTPKIAIDHILVSGSTTVHGFGAYPVPHTDHRAILATLTLPRSAS